MILKPDRAVTLLTFYTLILHVPLVLSLACDEGLVLDIATGQRVNLSIPAPGQCRRAYFEDANSYTDAFEPYKAANCLYGSDGPQSPTNQSFTLRLAPNTTLGLGRLIFFCGEQTIHCATLNITAGPREGTDGAKPSLQANCGQEDMPVSNSAQSSPQTSMSGTTSETSYGPGSSRTLGQGSEASPAPVSLTAPSTTSTSVADANPGDGVPSSWLPGSDNPSQGSTIADQSGTSSSGVSSPAVSSSDTTSGNVDPKSTMTTSLKLSPSQSAVGAVGNESGSRGGAPLGSAPTRSDDANAATMSSPTRDNGTAPTCICPEV